MTGFDLVGVLGGANGLAALIETHLRRCADVQAARSQAGLARAEGNHYDSDRSWCARTGGRDSILPAFVALPYLDAAAQHLRAVAVLLRRQDVKIAVSASTRVCCEASARAAFVLDTNSDSQERFTRALNESLRLVLANEDSARRRTHLRSLVELATALGITATTSKSDPPRVKWFGMTKPPSMTELTKRYLTRTGLVEQDFEKLWHHWNGAAHGGLDAGLMTSATTLQTKDVVRSVAALWALYALAQSQDERSRYMGYPDVMDVVLDRPLA